jgi:Rhodopirellula transposase DDE domain
MQADTAGDPMSQKRWSRKDTRSISQEMRAQGVNLCPNTVGMLLKDQDYSLRVNRKSIAETQHPDRNRQFELIADFRKRFEDTGHPILSMDTKKKELIGNFRNPVVLGVESPNLSTSMTSGAMPPPSLSLRIVRTGG